MGAGAARTLTLPLRRHSPSLACLQKPADTCHQSKGEMTGSGSSFQLLVLALLVVGAHGDTVAAVFPPDHPWWPACPAGYYLYDPEAVGDWVCTTCPLEACAKCQACSPEGLYYVRGCQRVGDSDLGLRCTQVCQDPHCQVGLGWVQGSWFAWWAVWDEVCWGGVATHARFGTAAEALQTCPPSPA